MHFNPGQASYRVANYCQTTDNTLTGKTAGNPLGVKIYGKKATLFTPEPKVTPQVSRPAPMRYRLRPPVPENTLQSRDTHLNKKTKNPLERSLAVVTQRQVKKIHHATIASGRITPATSISTSYLSLTNFHHKANKLTTKSSHCIVPNRNHPFRKKKITAPTHNKLITTQITINSTEDKNKNTCAVCFSEKRSVSLPCGHHACKPCVQAQIKIDLAYGHRPECISCKQFIPWRILKESVIEKTELYSRYKSYLKNTQELTNNTEYTQQHVSLLRAGKHVTGAEVKLFSKEIQSGKLRVCNRCKIVVERIAGCKHMVCTNCRNSFCWVCNKHWQAGHHNFCSLKTMTTSRTAEFLTI